jgi:endonuclease G
MRFAHDLLSDDVNLSEYLADKARRGALGPSQDSEHASRLADYFDAHAQLGKDWRKAIDSIIVADGRPSPEVVGGAPQIPSDNYWTVALTHVLPMLQRVCSSVGRVEVINDDNLSWIGTAFLVAPTTVATNRHVAALFAGGAGASGTFNASSDGSPMQVQIDFVDALQSDGRTAFMVSEVAYLAPDDAPDFALLRIANVSNTPGGTLGPPIELSAGGSDGEDVVVVGYPGPGTDPPDLAQRVFGGTYQVKRVSPGRICAPPSDTGVFRHDCSTGPGSSGSAVIDLASGGAVGIHNREGQFREANYGYLVDRMVTELKRLALLPTQ